MELNKIVSIEDEIEKYNIRIKKIGAKNERIKTAKSNI